jgi:uncharacterized protein YmfQ (DUF2313 family)
MRDARSKAAVLADLLSLLAPGRAWPRMAAANLVKLLSALAAAIARLEALVATLRTEINPASADAMLEDFERVLGPDPCGLDDGAGALSVRRLQAWRRWTRKGGASVAYFVALAAAYGITISVETTWILQCGDELGDNDEIVNSPEQYVWKVNVPLVWETDAECGATVCGDPLGDLGLSPVECLIRRYKPAHTTVLFSYS